MTDKHNENLVNITQEKWANAILTIGKAFQKKENVDNLVSHLLHEIYAFNNHCDVYLNQRWQKTHNLDQPKKSLLSYFLGQNKICIEDKGFAIKNWKSIKFENYKIIEHHNYLLSMGNYFLKTKKKNY